MASSSTLVDKIMLLATLAAVLFMFFRTRSRRMSYPPGPKKLPLLGNLFDFPAGFAWETYARWGREFNSDVVHLRAAGRDFVVLNSFKTATELLDKKSLIYSNRPQFTMMHELMGWDWLFVSMPYGEPWRNRRRLFLQHFRNVALYRPPQVKFVGRALIQLLDNPENFFKIIEDMAGGMSISLAYGLNVKDTNDPFVDLALRAFQTSLDSSFLGAFLVDIIPWLKYVPEWVPGAGFKKTAKKWRKLQNDFHELPFAESVKNTAAGTADPSLTSLSMAQLGGSVDNEQLSVIKDSAGMLYGGATDTTVSSITMFIVAMLSYPRVQKRAHDELDRVLEGRMPDFGDEQNLPYISAIYKEVLRWKPVVPLGFPHQLTEDDVHEGYHIPKGAVVMANSWAMLHNEDDYPDPSSFKPERFLTKDGKLNPAVRDPALIAFGFGRRICPGAQLARSILWLWIVSFLTNFEVSSPLDANGEPFEPFIEYQANSVTCHPHPFKCTIKPRSKASEELVRGFTDV